MARLGPLISVPLTAAALIASGCATLTVGERMTLKQDDPALFDLCVFTSDQGVLSRNTAQAVMHQAVGNFGHAAFRSATYVAGLDGVEGCDVALKVEGRNFAYGMRPTELYSARSKRRLATFESHAREGPDGAAEKAWVLLRPGTALHEQIQAEAGRARVRALAPAAAPVTQAPAVAAVARDELRQLMTEAMKSFPQAEALAATAPVSDVDAPRYKSPERAEDYAVVVGVERYNGLPDATYAERDAKAVYEHLIALGYPARNIALVTGAQATRTALVKNLEAWLPQNVDEKSTVFFYYSGHGAPDPAGGAAYLVPADGDPQYLQETAYPVKRVYEKLGALKARRVLVAMDSCFSGAGGRSVLAKGTRPLVGKIDMGAVGGKVVSLTASASAQISGALDEQRHGLFTYYLLKGLNGEARDVTGAVTVKSLHSYLAPKVQDAAKRANRDQAPQLLPADGDFRLR